MRLPRVYLSGPVTQGDRNYNTYLAFDIQRQLMEDDYAPYNPVASTCYPFAWQSSMPHDLWLRCDFPWVEVADVLFRLPNPTPSDGADREEEHAKRHGVPVVYSYTELRRWREEWEATQVTNAAGATA